MTVVPIVHGGGITEAARRFGGRTEDWLDLSTGINPNPVTLPEVPTDAWHRLPDRHLVDAAQVAAQNYYGSGASLPLPVPGTQSVIQLLPRLVATGRRAAIFGPTYGEYARVIAANGIAVDIVDDAGQVTDDHGLVVIVNPNNPTGRVHQRADILVMARRLAPFGGLILVDEAFADTQPEASVAGDVASHPNLLVFRSFGKFFGLAGLRLGFVIAAASILASFREWLGPWSVSGPALVVSSRLMEGDTFVVRSRIEQRKAALSAVLEEAGLITIGGTALFSLVAHPQAALLHAVLCERYILTRPFDYAADWLRIGLAPDAAADARLADALALFNSRKEPSA